MVTWPETVRRRQSLGWTFISISVFIKSVGFCETHIRAHPWEYSILYIHMYIYIPHIGEFALFYFIRHIMDHINEIMTLESSELCGWKPTTTFQWFRWLNSSRTLHRDEQPALLYHAVLVMADSLHKMQVLRTLNSFFYVSLNKLVNEHVSFGRFETSWSSCIEIPNSTSVLFVQGGLYARQQLWDSTYTFLFQFVSYKLLFLLPERQGRVYFL